MNVNQIMPNFAKSFLQDKENIELYETLTDQRNQLKKGNLPDFIKEKIYGFYVNDNPEFFSEQLYENTYLGTYIFLWNFIADRDKQHWFVYMSVMLELYLSFHCPQTFFQNQINKFDNWKEFEFLVDKYIGLKKEELSEYFEKLFFGVCDTILSENYFQADSDFSNYRTTKEIEIFKNFYNEIRAKTLTKVDETTKNEFLDYFATQINEDFTESDIYSNIFDRRMIIDTFYYMLCCSILGIFLNNANKQPKIDEEENKYTLNFITQLKSIRKNLLSETPIQNKFSGMSDFLEQIKFFIITKEKFLVDNSKEIIERLYCHNEGIACEDDFVPPYFMENNDFIEVFTLVKTMIVERMKALSTIRGYYFNQSVYHVNSFLAQELLETDFTSDISLEMLKEKNFSCLVADLSKVDYKLEYENTLRKVEMVAFTPIVFMVEELEPDDVDNANEYVDICVSNAINVALFFNCGEQYKIVNITMPLVINESKELILPEDQKDYYRVFNILLYYFSENADITAKYVNKPTTKKKYQNKNKKIERLQNKFCADQISDVPKEFLVGEGVGSRIKQAYEHNKKENEMTDLDNSKSYSQKRPHIRKGHYHQFWKGKRESQDRKLITHYLETTFVNMSKDEL